MRSDVNKVLTECYKEGSGAQPKFPRRTTQKIFDEVGGKVGIRFEHVRTKGHNAKSFGENLAYLPRFLAKNVGRKWDDIYSEISATFDKRSTVNAHIFQHLFDYFVPANEVVFVEGRPHRVDSYNTFPILAGSYRELYVDPRNGILRKAKRQRGDNWKQAREKDNKAKELAQKRVLSPTQEMFKLEDGFWYVFDLKKIPASTISYEFVEPYPRDFDEQRAWHCRKIEFDALPKSEKEKVGKRVVHGQIRTDAGRKVPYGYRSPLTEDKTIRTKGGKHYERKTILATHYYASMRSASKKELRAVGL